MKSLRCRLGFHDYETVETRKEVETKAFLAGRRPRRRTVFIEECRRCGGFRKR